MFYFVDCKHLTSSSKEYFSKAPELILGWWASTDTLVVGVREIMSQYSSVDIGENEELLATATEYGASLIPLLT